MNSPPLPRLLLPRLMVDSSMRSPEAPAVEVADEDIPF